MKNISRYKVEYNILIPLFFLFIISIMSIYSANQMLPSSVGNLALKQTIWYLFGFAIAYFIMVIKNDFFIKYCWILYGIGIISLILLFPFGTIINGAKSWYSFFNLFTIQPSEFMKIILIITIAKIINDFNIKYHKPTIKQEIYLFIKVGIITFIPVLLTFLQPDTGIVVIYIVIMFVMLLISGIRWQVFAVFFGILIILISIFFGIYYWNSDLFIDLFGTNFFYRIDRLLAWQKGSGMQLNNAIVALGSAGLFGFGFGHTPIYFPEPQTDFIFSVYASNTGLIGTLFLIMLIIFFNLKLINIANRTTNKISKYITAGILGMLLYQQIQSIGMNIGLLPITGITFPFISYGGSSLLSYMIMVGIIFNLSNESLRFTNVNKK
jgi:rod shape determining protein RodA